MIAAERRLGDADRAKERLLRVPRLSFRALHARDRRQERAHVRILGAERGFGERQRPGRARQGIVELPGGPEGGRLRSKRARLVGAAVAIGRRADAVDPDRVWARGQLRISRRHGEPIRARGIGDDCDVLARLLAHFVVDHRHGGARRVEHAHDEIGAALIDRDRGVLPGLECDVVAVTLGSDDVAFDGGSGAQNHRRGGILA